MEQEKPFEDMVEDSFDRIEEVMYQHGLQRLTRMEEQLLLLEQDLSDMIDLEQPGRITRDRVSKSGEVPTCG